MSVYEFGPFQLDAERLLLLEGGEPMALGPKVVETLLALIEHPGDVLTKNALLDRIWPEGYVDEANLAQNVYVLRKMLRLRWNLEVIETIPRRGYRFTAPVRRRCDVPLAEPTAIPAAIAPAPRRYIWRGVAAAALAVVLVAGLAFGLSGPRRVSARPALSVPGARLYQMGRHYWNLRTRDGIGKSLTYFSRVIASDPRDARGYAALASANAIMGDYEFGPSHPAVYYARARAYAQKALALDPSSGEAYAVLGMISSQTHAHSFGDLKNGLAQLQHAIELDPSNGPAHEWYGVALLASGRVNDAYGELQRSAQLDPLSVATTAWLGQAAYLNRHYDDAITYSHETLDLSPQRYDAFGTLGLAYEARGDDAQALAAFNRMGDACTMCRAEAAALLANLYAKTNHLVQAQAELSIARAHAKDVEPADLALAFAALGQRRVALSVLRRERGDYMAAQIANDPRFDALRSDAQEPHLQQKPA
jgi:DNA-binding winged helix-turn-helix (wHTH) protein/tetratricopeptide (TPR) repeat protein